MTTIAKRLPADQSLPYAPSFLDRFMNSVERLPVPYWVTYLVLFVLQSTLVHVLAWFDGWLPAYKLDALLLLFPAWQWVPLAIMTYLDLVSVQALSIFGPLLDVDESEGKKLAYEFSTMPARGAILSGAVWAIIYVIITIVFFDAYGTLGIGPWLTAVLVFEGLIAYMTGSAIYYYSLRLLYLVNRTVKKIRRFNVFRPDPVYAFARVTSLVGVSWMIMLTITLLLFPTPFVEGMVLALLILQVGLGVAAFVLPLWFVHRRLESEKLRLLEEFHRQVEQTTGRLHRCLDEDDMVPVTQLKDAMLGLSAEREILNALPTWPWRPGTLAGFLSATLLPILLFVLQVAIGRLLGK